MKLQYAVRNQLKNIKYTLNIVCYQVSTYTALCCFGINYWRFCLFYKIACGRYFLVWILRLSPNLLDGCHLWNIHYLVLEGWFFVPAFRSVSEIFYKWQFILFFLKSRKDWWYFFKPSTIWWNALNWHRMWIEWQLAGHLGLGQ